MSADKLFLLNDEIVKVPLEKFAGEEFSYSILLGYAIEGKTEDNIPRNESYYLRDTFTVEEDKTMYRLWDALYCPTYGAAMALRDKLLHIAVEHKDA